MLKSKHKFILENARHVCQGSLMLLAIAIFTGLAGAAKAIDDFETVTQTCLEEGISSSEVAERFSAQGWAGVTLHSLSSYADLYGDWIVLRGVLIEGVPSLPQEDLHMFFKKARHEIVSRDTLIILNMKLADDARTSPAFKSLHYLHDGTGLVWLETLEDVKGLTCRLFVANSASTMSSFPNNLETLENPYEKYVRMSGKRDAGGNRIMIAEVVSDGFNALTGVPPNLSWFAEIKRLDRDYKRNRGEGRLSPQSRHKLCFYFTTHPLRLHLNRRPNLSQFTLQTITARS